MIPARKGGPLSWAWGHYVHHKFRSTFRALWTRGALPEAGTPLLVYANHTNWWDGFVAHELCRALGWDAYCMMEEQNLLRYRFLARLGAFSVRRGESSSALETLRYARGLLARPRAAVFLFPQGKIRPFAARPLSFERGLEVLARRADAQCLPLAIRYTFLEAERPDVLCEVGNVHAPLPFEECEARLTALLDAVSVAQDVAGFVPQLRGGWGVAETWDRVRGLSRESA